MKPAPESAGGTTTRRGFVGLAMLAPLAVAVVPALGAEPTACYDPASLSLSQKSRRRALGYMDQSDNPDRHCGGCGFFTGGTSGCGTCAMLGGGPVAATGVCGSFAARSGK